MGSAMMDELGDFVSRLREQTHFQGAAALVLRRMSEIAERTISGSRYGRTARALRGLVHLRPEGGYRGLHVLEHGEAEPEEAAGRPSFLPSATTWRWVESKRVPIAVDAHLGTIRTLRGDSGEEEMGRPFGEGGGSIHRLRLRDVTHLLVLPLLGPAKQVLGMISIEVACKAAIGEEFVWSECVAELELYAAVGTPYLATLPLPISSDEADDPLVPVVGARTRPLLRILRAFAEQEEPILFLGPTGVGKSRLARWAHARSPRRSGPLEVIDLSSFPEEMQLAELFGWRKGAFTSAVRDHEGAIARAEGGTLFLDEISNLTAKAQAGLLKLIEDRSYRPLGSGGIDRQADVRFIVASNTDLASAVSEGRFREDLYYRINVLPVRLPCLRERVDEIVPWAVYMLERQAASTTTGARAEFSAAVLVLLETYTWPGNLRQVDNVVRRAFAIASADSSDGDRVVVGEHEVLAALQLDSERPLVGVIEALENAASALVADAERLEGRGSGGIGLDSCDALAGLVLLEAIRRQGSVEQAFGVLGRGDLVANRNHGRKLRQAVTRLADLYAALERPLTEEIRRILDRSAP